MSGILDEPGRTYEWASSLKVAEAHKLAQDVFFLGAGFSAGAGIPTMGAFINRAKSYLRDFMRPHLTGPIATVSEYLEGANSLASKFQFPMDNLEELYSLLDMEIRLGALDKIQLRKSFIQMIASTIIWSESRSRLPEIVTKPTQDHQRQMADLLNIPTLPLLDHYASFLLQALGIWSDSWRETAFITLNYDGLLERRLHTLNVHADFLPDPQGKVDHRFAVPVLKLHGSVNHAICEDPSRTCTPHGFTPTLDRPWETSAKCECGKIKDSAWLTPPTWNKGSVHPAMDRIWERAFHHLALARRLFIIGYSLPITDQYVRHLFRASLSKNKVIDRIYIVNSRSNSPEGKQQFDETIDRYRSLFSVEFWNNKVSTEFAEAGLAGIIDNVKPLLLR